MADKIKFSLVSPERELFSGLVDQVDLPGTEGGFGIMPNHSPFMAAIRTGAITVFDGGKETQFFIAGGFADVTAEGLTVLAERAMPMSAMTADGLAEDIRLLTAELEGLEGDAAFTATQNLDGLKALAAL